MVHQRRSANGPDGQSAAAAAGLATYRIEHHRGDAAVVVGHSDDPMAPFTALPPHAMRLLDAGATGALLLVDEATGDVLARRALLPETRLAPISPARKPAARPVDRPA